MQLLKDLFFFVGSILGILAFLRTVLQPLVERNRERWKQVKEVLSENDLRNLSFQTWNSRCINDELLTKVSRLVYAIEEDAEFQRFGPLLRRQYKQAKDELVSAYRKYREYVQVPYWEPQSRTAQDSEQSDRTVWVFNKKEFANRQAT